MANLRIIDTGYVNEDNDGTQETIIANGGNSIELKGITLDYSRSQNIDNAPNTGTESNAELNPATVENPKITIKGTINRTNTTEMSLIIKFDTLTRSKGLKLLYYNSTDDDISAGGTDGWSNVISSLGVDNVNGNTDEDGSTVVDVHTQSGGSLYNSGDPFPHLHVFVKSFQINQSANGQLLRYTLTCEVQ